MLVEVLGRGEGGLVGVAQALELLGEGLAAQLEVAPLGVRGLARELVQLARPYYIVNIILSLSFVALKVRTK